MQSKMSSEKVVAPPRDKTYVLKIVQNVHEHDVYVAVYIADRSYLEAQNCVIPCYLFLLLLVRERGRRFHVTYDQSFWRMA
jgi:hypothetical protein